MHSLWCIIGVLYVCGLNAEICRIPSGQQYSSSVYRPQYASSPRKYRPAQSVRHLTRIVIICKKDIYHDAIRHTRKSRCVNGKWNPELPSCEAKRRCQAPDVVSNATPSRPLDQYITFPHRGIVKFTCNVGMLSVGNGTTICNEGSWTSMNLRCEDAPQSLPLMQSPKRDPCDDIVVPNGEVTPVHGEHGKYKVTCKKETTINAKADTYTCQQGKWMGLTPICRNAPPKQTSCRYPYRIRSASILKSKVSGQAIDTYFVPDGTRVTQTCRTKRNVVRHAVCNNKRWTPPLMNCHRFKNNLSFRQAVYENCTIPESVENVTYSNTQNAAVVSYVGGDIIETGQAIERKCFEQVNEDIVYASTTIHCVNGDWKPILRPCGPLKVTRYRLHINTTQTSGTFPSRVVVSGTRRRNTFLPLQDFTVNSQNVREYDTNAPHVGDIRRLWLEMPDPSYQLRVNFLSVYSHDADTYYVSRNVDVHSKNSRKRLCPRKFRSEPGWNPDWSAQTDYKTLKKVKDTTDCNMACVEEDEFHCLATVYDNGTCSLFNRLDKVDMQGKPDVGGAFNVREDNC